MTTVLCCLVVITGCTTTSPSPRSYEDLVQSVQNGEEISIEDIRLSFLSTHDFPKRLQRISTLERQALRLLVDEPLKLGAIGTAILDIYYGSLAGHLALAAFYDRVEDETAGFHRDWSKRIVASIESGADGTRKQPYRVFSGEEARSYLIALGRTPVGSIYQSDKERPFMMVIASKPPLGPLANVFFNLGDAYAAVSQQINATSQETEFTPGALIGFLAQRDDSAAQAFIGTYLASEDRLDESINWLSASTRSGNVIANLTLARVWWTKARRHRDEQARSEAVDLAIENYRRAISIGSDEAMYMLAVLYLRDQLGPNKLHAGIELMEQASALENTQALIYLGQLYFDGRQIERNMGKTAAYFIRAAELNDDFAKLQYARFLMHPDVDRPFERQAYHWLQEVARQDNPDAMLVLGNLYARGVHVNRSFRRAFGWFRKAIASAPEDASIINEVAWTLAVTNLEKLRKPEYALEIMTGIMESDLNARQTPAYLDTWAAAHAASGDFTRAVDLQTEAVDQATRQEQNAVIDVLQEHLEAFKAGRPVIDPIP
ncbi:MAG: tetratricopeptide repeat protein [Pseudomonadales bacterium]